MLENSWNTSFRIMFHLHFATHRYFVEPITNKIHLKSILMKRFLGFLSQIEKSPKLLPLKLLKIVQNDVRSTTGSNLRNIMLLFGKCSTQNIKMIDIDSFEFAPVKPEDFWKVSLVKEIIDIKADQIDVEGFTKHELDEILEYVCTS